MMDKPWIQFETLRTVIRGSVVKNQDEQIATVLLTMVNYIEYLAHLEQSPVLPPHRHALSDKWLTNQTSSPIPEEPAETPQSGPTLPVSANVNPGATIKPSREQEIAEETRSISGAINSLHRLGVPSAELEDQILPALLNKIYGHMSSTQPADRTTGRSASIDESADAPSRGGWSDLEWDNWAIDIAQKVYAENRHREARVVHAAQNNEPFMAQVREAYEAEQRGDKGTPWSELKAELFPDSSIHEPPRQEGKGE